MIRRNVVYFFRYALIINTSLHFVHRWLIRECFVLVVTNAHDAIVHYICGHVEHEDCYFDNLPHNLTCNVYGKESKVLVFKYVPEHCLILVQS